MTTPKKPLTDAFIRSLKPADPGKRYSVHDTLISGLSVRVTESGGKTFLLTKRWGTSPNPAARALGKFGPTDGGDQLTLAGARAKARDWLGLRAEGKDPAEERRKAEVAAAVARGNTFAAVMTAFLASHVKGQRRAAKVEYEMRVNLLPTLKDRPITEITRAELATLIGKLAARAPYQAHNVWGHLSVMFNWLVEEPAYGVSVSPCWPKKPPCLRSKEARKKSRPRVLDDRELAAFWAATGTLHDARYGGVYRMLVLTGARLNEIARLVWEEVDSGGGLITIPPERFKSEAVHLIPLSDAARAVLKAVPVGTEGRFVFSFKKGRVPLSGFGKAKIKLDAAMTEILGEPVKPFVIHDVRRTVRTRLSMLRVPEAVAELVIGHARKGLAGVYDRHYYLDERRDALQRWAAELDRIVNPQRKVVKLRG